METQTYYPAPDMVRTYDQILVDWLVFTPEQRSLAWCPEPPREAYPSDCRRGGACGLAGLGETLRDRWIIARFRMRREQTRGAR